MRCGRQAVRHAEIDEARLLPAEDDLDREAERLLGVLDELRGVLRDAQRVRPDRPHRPRREAAQPLAEPCQRFERPELGGAVEAPVAGQAAAEPDRLAQRVEEVDLAVDDPSDLEVEAVRPEVDGGERVELHECGLGGGGPAHLSTRGVPQQRPRRYDFTAASISSSETCRTSLPFVM